MQIIKCDRCKKELNPINVVLVNVHELMTETRKNMELCKDCADKQIKYNIEFDNYTKVINENINVLMSNKVNALEKKYFSENVSQ